MGTLQSLLRFLLLFGLVKTDEFLGLPIINTDKGKIVGYRMQSRSGRNVFGFSGIPYAKPPLGNLRFMDPVPMDNWKGVKITIDYGLMCPQVMFTAPMLKNVNFGEEDCLYLSVYTPDIKKKLPVLVYIHGGAFAVGFGEITHNPSYLMDHDIVVVTFNFRFGILGFLSLGDKVIPGNSGMKDQVMALKWVKNNIEKFGGDPNMVTIMGISSGAASVHYHMKSPLSKGLFHRAVTIGGNSLATWAFVPTNVAKSRGIKLAKLMACPTDNSLKILKCLQSKNAYSIMRKFENFFIWKIDPTIIFGPTIDRKSQEPFLPKDPWGLITEPVPWLVSLAKYDGISRTRYFISDSSALRTVGKNNELLAISLYLDLTYSKPLELVGKIKEYYIGSGTLSMKNFENLTNIYSDCWFLHPTMLALKNHTGPKYLYEFNYVGTESFSKFFSEDKVLIGSQHVDDEFYLWNQIFMGFGPFKGKDLDTSKLLVKLHTDFVKYGKPLANHSSIKWDEWNSREKRYLQINNNGITMQSDLKAERVAFWAKLTIKDKFCLPRC